MDLRTRWAQIVWMDQDEVEALHHREIWLGTRSGRSNLPLFTQKKMGTWQAMDLISKTMSRKFPEGFFPQGMDVSAQYKSIDDFRKAIYPIWKGIEEKDKEIDDKLTAAEVGKPGQMLFEIGTVHRQDLAIMRSGIKPHRSSGDQEKMVALRKKALRASGADRASGGYND